MYGVVTELGSDSFAKRWDRGISLVEVRFFTAPPIKEMTMSLFVVDVEADGPAPGLYSMTEFAAVKLDKVNHYIVITANFKSNLMHPISEVSDPNALRVTNQTRDNLFNNGVPPSEEMIRFNSWVSRVNKGRAVMISDNIAFDWMFMHWYMIKFVDSSPFGFSGRRIGDLHAGLTGTMYNRWKHLRKTSHTHDPLDDATGNAEAIIQLSKMGLTVAT